MYQTLCIAIITHTPLKLQHLLKFLSFLTWGQDQGVLI